MNWQLSSTNVLSKLERLIQIGMRKIIVYIGSIFSYLSKGTIRVSAWITAQAQTAIAQRRIIFGVENFLQGDVRHAVDFDAFQNVEQAEVVQVVFQRAADEILD